MRSDGLVDVVDDGVRRDLVGARHEADVIRLESRCESGNTDDRAPSTGLLGHHRAPAHAGQRRAIGILMQVVGIRPVVSMRR